MEGIVVLNRFPVKEHLEVVLGARDVGSAA